MIAPNGGSDVVPDHGKKGGDLNGVPLQLQQTMELGSCREGDEHDISMGSNDGINIEDLGFASIKWVGEQVTRKDNAMGKIVQELKHFNLTAQLSPPGRGLEDMSEMATQGHVEDPLEESALEIIAEKLMDDKVGINVVKGFVQSHDAMEGTRIEGLRAKLLGEFASTVFCGKTGGGSPCQGSVWGG